MNIKVEEERGLYSYLANSGVKFVAGGQRYEDLITREYSHEGAGSCFADCCPNSMLLIGKEAGREAASKMDP